MGKAITSFKLCYYYIASLLAVMALFLVAVILLGWSIFSKKADRFFETVVDELIEALESLEDMRR